MKAHFLSNYSASNCTFIAKAIVNGQLSSFLFNCIREAKGGRTSGSRSYTVALSCFFRRKETREDEKGRDGESRTAVNQTKIKRARRKGKIRGDKFSFSNNDYSSSSAFVSCDLLCRGNARGIRVTYSIFSECESLIVTSHYYSRLPGFRREGA